MLGVARARGCWPPVRAALRGFAALVALTPLVVAVLDSGAGAFPGTPVRVSVHTDGTQGGAGSGPTGVSANGEYVVFASDATNLVAGDTNGVKDIFVRNVATNTTVRVSVASDGTQGNNAPVPPPPLAPTNDGAMDPAISANGRHVVFASASDNLVGADTNGSLDVFVHDRDSDADGIFDEAGAISTKRASVSSLGAESIGGSRRPQISANGRFVVFDTYAKLTAEAQPDQIDDVLVHDRDTDADGVFDEAGFISTIKASVATNGTETDLDSRPSSISDNGRYVAFASQATNLVAGDTNGHWDVFLRDRDTDADGVFDELGAVNTSRISVDSAGTQAVGGTSEVPAISGDGTIVAFESEATNLVAGDTNGADDIFVRNIAAGTTVRVSVTTAGAQVNGASRNPVVSIDGTIVAFDSTATDLVAGDTNGASDVFVRDRTASETFRASVTATGVEGNGGSSRPAVGANGDDVSLASDATNLVVGDSNGVSDAFVIDVDAPAPSTSTSSTTSSSTTSSSTTSSSTTSSTTTTVPLTTTTSSTTSSTTTTTVPPTTTTSSTTTVPLSTTSSTTTTTAPSPTTTTTTGVVVPNTIVVPTTVTPPTVPVTAATVPRTQPEEHSARPAGDHDLARGSNKRVPPTVDDGAGRGIRAPFTDATKVTRTTGPALLVAGGLLVIGWLLGAGFFFLPVFVRRRRKDDGEDDDAPPGGTSATSGLSF